jgi:hypothetical protein
MDHTLSHIVVPMLKQLKESAHGHPIADPEDAPTIGEGVKVNEWEVDSKAEERWAWIMDEMIWAHEQVIDDQADKNYYDEYMPDEPVEVTGIFKDLDVSEKSIHKMGKFNKDKYDKYQSRVNNGLRLFGKYYQNLWD